MGTSRGDRGGNDPGAGSRGRRLPVVLLGIVALVATTSVGADSTASAATPPTIAVGDVTVPEGDGGTTPARLAVRLSDPVATTTVVRFATIGGTAAAGTDYRARSGAVRIRAGRTSAVIAIRVFGDIAAESPETVSVRVTDAGSIAISDAVGTVTVRDDESQAGIAIGDAEIWEGDSKTGLAKLTVVLDAPVGVNTVVSYTMSAVTANAPGDFRTRTARVTIRAGRRVAAITPRNVGDTSLEPDESFHVVLTGTGASGVPIADAIGTVTIRNDEPAPPPPPPPLETPGVPTGLSVVAGPLARYLTADWTPPAGNAAITGYDLEVTRGGTTNVITDTAAPATFGCGLAEVTDSCTVRVRARNTSGDGPWTDPVTASTWSPPAAPPNLEVLAGGGAVSWDVPTSDRPITQYQVHKQADGSSSWEHVTTTTLTHAATTCGFCSVRVSAQSDIGIGPWSTVEIARPGAPGSLAATRDPDNHELVHVTWVPPLDPGSHPVTSYEVFVDEVPLTPTAATSVDVFLRSTITWQIQVYATNLAGQSVLPATISLPAG